MRKQAWKILAVLAMTVAGVLAQEVIEARLYTRIDQEHTKWISDVMGSVSTIKPGMTRSDLFRVFVAEGGISTRTHMTYVYKHCPLIKVDVDFSPVDASGATDENAAAVSPESPADRIIKISRPYLEGSHVD